MKIPQRMFTSGTEPVFHTQLGQLYAGDCLKYFSEWAHGEWRPRFDLVFLDPPFNLNKDYGPDVDDQLDPAAYRESMRQWILGSSRLVAPGGSFFLYHVPQWCSIAHTWLCEWGELEFRHLITVKVTGGPPRGKGLYPSHYGLLCMTRGEARTFKKLKVPIDRCRHCGKELRDYGGHRGELKENGVNLSDIWLDVPSVRHAKYKADGWRGPQLSTKLIQRVVTMTTNTGDSVLDPFAGSGTTAAVCEATGRRWVTVEKADWSIIKRRLTTHPVPFHPYADWEAGSRSAVASPLDEESPLMRSFLQAWRKHREAKDEENRG